jgi:hypothetical protein
MLAMIFVGHKGFLSGTPWPPEEKKLKGEGETAERTAETSEPAEATAVR